MKIIINNHNNLRDEDITEVVTRVKVMLINNLKQVVLANNDNILQLPGGHVEKDESLLECIKREIKEETGILLNNLDVNPFLLIKYYSKDYPKEGKNRVSEIYYYVIETDDEINYEETNFTEREKEGNFKLQYIDVSDVERVLVDNISNNPKNEIIVKEMLEAFEEYNKL